MAKTYNVFANNNIYEPKKKSLKEKITEEIAKRYPFFKSNTEEPTINRQLSYNPFMRKLFEFNPTYSPLNYAKMLFAQSRLRKELELEESLQKLRAYANTICKSDDDDIDFEINGIPVKIYEKFIQIGVHIIPNDCPMLFLNRLKEKQKKEITTLIINITNNIENNYYQVV